MLIDKFMKHMIYLFIIFAATFYYGAYALAAVVFFILLAAKPKKLLQLINGERAILAFLTAALLSTLVAKSIYGSLLIDGVLLLNFMAFIIMLAFTKKDTIDGIMTLLNTMAIVICLYGVYQYLTGDLNVDRSWTDQRVFGSLVRIYSTLRNPNIFATYLTFNLSFAVASIVKHKGDVYTSINIMLSSVCLILTYSRGGFFAFLAAMLVIAVLSRDWKVGFYVLVMCLLYYSYNTIGEVNRAGLGLLIADSSSLYRLEIWKQSMKLFTKNILLGSGPGSVMKTLSYSSDTLKGVIVHSHNVYIQILAELGILGFGTFAAMLVCWLKKLFKFQRDNRGHEHAYIAIGFAASITAFLVHGLMDCTTFVPSRSLIFVVYFSLFPAMFIDACKERINVS